MNKILSKQNYSKISPEEKKGDKLATPQIPYQYNHQLNQNQSISEKEESEGQKVLKDTCPHTW